MQIVASAAFASCVAMLIYFVGNENFLIAAPFAFLWVLSPLVARWASLPPRPAGHLSVTPSDALALRLIARRTWRFFEEFVTEASNMLPPDNFQEDPEPVVANRTSPTNIGLYLLSVAAAYDFGWSGMLSAIERLEAAFATMGKLERFRGHFFNWYDTTNLRPLEPKYISSVDSGNLAGHLIALGNACREMIAAPVVDPRWRSGLNDTLELVRESLHLRVTAQGPQATKDAKILAAIDLFAASLQDARSNPAGIAALLVELSRQAELIVSLAREQAERTATFTDAETEIIVWTEALRVSVQAQQRDIDFLMPWARHISESVAGDDELVAALDRIVSLDELPGHCEAALQLIAQRRAKNETNESWAALVDALGKSVSAANSSSIALLRWSISPTRHSTIWSLAFCSMAIVSCFPSAIVMLTGASIPVSMICWRRKRGLPVSSQSPKVIFPPSIGSGLGGR